MLRHKGRMAGETRAELSGHFHPKLTVSKRGRSHRPALCRDVSENRLILPAFGALTGGMDAADPAILNGHAARPRRSMPSCPRRARLARLSAVACGAA
jgi:metallophosphoesterase superfamily enzyme